MDFTEQHRRVRERATAVATGEDPVSTAAVVGVYGSGKSTLLFHLLNTAPASGVVAIWEEAAAFVERLVPAGERVPAHEFAKRVQEWVESVKAGEGMVELIDSLAARGRADIGHALARQTELDRRAVLLLDEMEQAYELLRERVRTDDRNPLRALLDSCGRDLALIVAYAPESFLSLGDADKGRHRVLHVPALRASAIASVFELSRGEANFAWWASRGRARGVVQAIDTVIKPAQSGEFEGDPQALADAMDSLPPIFGVPAVVRDYVSLTKLGRLLDLAPVELESSMQGISFDLRDEIKLTESLEEALMATLPADARATAQRLLREVIAILDACVDEDKKAYVPFDQLDALYGLAASRAQEVGLGMDVPEDWRTRAVAVLVSEGASSLSRALPLSIPSLAEEVFPSPFTNPLLPVAGRQPTRVEVEREFTKLRERDEALVVRWTSRATVFAADPAALERWLEGTTLGAGGLTALLIERRDGPATPLTSVLSEAGRLEVISLPSFSAEFVKSVLVASDAVPGGDDDFDARARALATSKDLRRKINWHIRRLDLVVRQGKPQQPPNYETAVNEAKSQLVPFLQRGRLRQSPALFALVPLVAEPSEITQTRLKDVAGLLREGGTLRGMIGGERLLRGADVVVDELLPGSGESESWVYDEPYAELKALVMRHSAPQARRALATLIDDTVTSPLSTILIGDPAAFDNDPELDGGLRALKELWRLLDRISRIRDGLGAMLDESVERVEAKVNLGESIQRIAAARPELEKIQLIMITLGDLPEPWARRLVEWVVGRYAHSIHANAEEEIPTLQKWERCAQAGRKLGSRISQFADAMRERGVEGIAYAAERLREAMRDAMGSADALHKAQQACAERLGELKELSDGLADLEQFVSERGLSIEGLIRSFEPESSAINVELGRVRKTIELLKVSGEKPPAPIGGELGEWLDRVAQYLTRTRVERLQKRLAELVGEYVDAEALDPVYDEEVSRFEQGWKTLEEDFKAGYLKELRVHKPESSGDLARGLDEVLAIQGLVVGRSEEPWAAEHDRALRGAAASGRKQREWVAEELEARKALKDLIVNHAEVSAPGEVIQAVIDGESSFRAALKKLESFLGEVSSARSVLDRLDLEPTLPELDDEVSAAGFLATLAKQAEGAERELSEQTARIESLRKILAEFSAEPPATSTPTSLKTAVRMIEDTEGKLRKALAEQSRLARERAFRLGVAPTAVVSNDLEQWARMLIEWQGQLNAVEHALAELEAVGVTPSSTEASPADEVVTRLRAEKNAMDQYLQGLRFELDSLRVRGRLLGEDLVTEIPPPRIDALKTAIDEATKQLQAAIKLRVAKLNDPARSVWVRLQEKTSLPPQIGELVDSGLLIVVGAPAEEPDASA
ncbi:MAG: hypothetical protein H6713_03895 [Myxococcales bacterium]|nr:hypothetical protein [Myxococcales bacterium]